MCIYTDALTLADALSRQRPLSDSETDIVAKVVNRMKAPSVYTAWSAKEDAVLLDMKRRLKSNRRIGVELDRTRGAVMARYRLLRRGKISDG